MMHRATSGQPESFTDDPVASHSARFGLARPLDAPAGTDEPSPPGVRPWNLRAARPPAGVKP
jgi:hypothetical protein